MKRFNILYLLAFILAFCSIVYELILAQSLSAFLENTVLRYSVTIGLYMFSMGFGALAAEGRFVRHPVLTLLRIEIFLTVIGGLSVILLYGIDSLLVSRLLFSVCAHTLIIFIGILTGAEVPLLIALLNTEKGSLENTVLGVNYTGAFLGTIVFAFVFYPRLGLVSSSFCVAFLNAAAGLLLSTQRHRVDEERLKPFRVSLGIQAFLLFIIGAGLFCSQRISDFFVNRYIG